MLPRASVINPVVALPIKTPNGSLYLNFLLDTGAQVSLLDYDSLQNSNCSFSSSSASLISLGINKKVEGFSLKTNLTLPDCNSVNIEIFCLPSLNLNMNVEGINSTIEKLKTSDIPLSTNLPKYRDNSICINGVLGNDILTNFKVFSYETIKGVKMLRLSNGFIPVGSTTELIGKINLNVNKNVKNSRDSIQVDSIQVDTKNKFEILSDVHRAFGGRCGGDGVPSNSVNKLRKRHKVNNKEYVVPKKYESSVNFVINPKQTYFSPLLEFYDESQVDHGLENLFSLETIGIKNENCSSYDEEEIAKFKNSIKLKNNQYHVDLPWNRELLDRVPSNFAISKAIARKVSEKNGKLDEKYFEVFREQQKLGIIEEIDSPLENSRHIWIPHRPVIRDDPLVLTTKIRPVFNASLKVGKFPSLNEAAYPGTDLLNDSLGLLQYFRTNNNILLADISKAFLNVKLNKESDKNCFSFIVHHDNKFHYFRYNSIIFGFISSPFILNFLIKYHASLSPDPIVKDVLSNKFYVDNVVYTSNCKNEIVQVGHKVDESLEAAGFKLQEWCANDIDIQSQFDNNPLTLTKFLGYCYDPCSDEIAIRNSKLNEFATTKREILSSISSIYDPLGLMSPCLVKAKLFIRKLCNLKYNWDECLPFDILKEWKLYVFEINSVDCTSNLRIPRKVASSDEEAKLIIFTDASKQSYGFSIYCVQGMRSSLIFSKFKLSPVPSKTLPSLELLAIFLAIKCTINILSDLNFNIPVKNITLLTDSQVALSWVLSGRVVKKNVFVSNRIKDMITLKNKLTELEINYSFEYVPTEHNIADILTRPFPLRKFVECKDIWINGPTWICLPTSQWPKGQLGCLPSPFNANTCNLTLPIINDLPLCLIPISKFSSYSRLLGCTFQFFKAASLFRGESVSDASLKEKSFNYLIKCEQSKHLPEELCFLLKSHKTYDEAPKLVKSLNLFLDTSGIIRSKGRISKNLQLSYDAIHPILLSNKSDLSRLIISDCHFSCKHLGIDSTLYQIRQSGFWIIRARSSIKTELKKCIICNKLNSRAFVKPPTPALPKDRVNYVQPFFHTGIDYTGHFYVKNNRGERHKIYILIFTCMNSRAIHLETVHTMSVQDFILAFVRFHNRYGLPRILYTDNARSFISGVSLLSDVVGSDFFQREYVRFNIVHKTIPAYSPWFGATWERLIRTIKHCLYKTIGRNIIHEINFVTALSDIQLAVNNRPLTYRGEDGELDAVTPNHLVSSSCSFPSLILSDASAELNLEQDEIKESLVNTLQIRDILIERFRKEWYLKYLLSLRDKHKNSFCLSELHDVQNKYLHLGSVVLIKHPVKPRPYWNLGRITELIAGEDGLVRVVRVLKADHSVVTTSIANLYPLELDSRFTDTLCDFEVMDGDSLDRDVSYVEVDLNEPVPLNTVSPVIDDDLESTHSSLEDGEDSFDPTPDSFDNPTFARPPRQAALRFQENLETWIKENQI